MTSVGLELLQQKGLRERISPICTLSQNGYGNLMCVSRWLHLHICEQSMVPSKSSFQWVSHQDFR